MKLKTAQLLNIDRGLYLFTSKDANGNPTGFIKMRPSLGLKIKKITRLITEPMQEYTTLRNQLIEEKGVPVYDTLPEKVKEILTSEQTENAKKVKTLTSEHSDLLTEMLEMEHELDIPFITMEDLDSMTEEVDPAFVDLLEPIIMTEEKMKAIEGQS